MKNYARLVLIMTFSFLMFATTRAQKKALFPGTPGVQTYTFRNTMKNDLGKALDSMKLMGLTVLESGTNPNGLTAEEFKKMLDDRKLISPSVGANYAELVKDAKGIAQKAKIIGATYVMCAWIPHQGQFTLENAKQTVVDFNNIGKILRENGITLAYHTHGFEFVPFEDGTLFDYIVKNTDPKFVSFEMDIMWTFHGGQDPAKLLLKYPTRWKLMHLKDLRKGIQGDLTGGTSTENDVALGTGQLNIPEILKAAKKVGIKYYFIEDESLRYREQIPQTISYLNSLKE